MRLYQQEWFGPADLLLPPSRAVLLHDDAAFEARCRQALLATQMHEQQHPLGLDVRIESAFRTRQTSHICSRRSCALPYASSTYQKRTRVGVFGAHPLALSVPRPVEGDVSLLDAAWGSFCKPWLTHGP